MTLLVLSLAACTAAWAQEAPQAQGAPKAQDAPKRPRPPRVPRPGVKTPGVKVPIDRLKPEAVFEIPGTPDWIAVDTFVWVSNKPKNEVAQLNTKTNKVEKMVTVGQKPCSGLAVGFGSLWVPNCGDQSVSRVDLKSGKVTATFPIGVADSEGGVATGAGSFWIVTDKEGTLARVDPDTNKTVAEIALPPGAANVIFANDVLWATSTKTDQLLRIDPATNLITERISVGKTPRFLTAGGGFIWTLNQGDGSVTKVDIKTNKSVATIECGVPGGGGEISYGGGSVWVTTFEFPITRIDEKENKVVQQFEGPGGDAIRYGAGFVWLSNLRAGNLWKIDPKLITATVAD